MKIHADPDHRPRCRHRSGDPDCECWPECKECGELYDPTEGHTCQGDEEEGEEEEGDEG